MVSELERKLNKLRKCAYTGKDSLITDHVIPKHLSSDIASNWSLRVPCSHYYKDYKEFEMPTFAEMQVVETFLRWEYEKLWIYFYEQREIMLNKTIKEETIKVNHSKYLKNKTPLHIKCEQELINLPVQLELHKRQLATLKQLLETQQSQILKAAEDSGYVHIPKVNKSPGEGKVAKRTKNKQIFKAKEEKRIQESLDDITFEDIFK